MESPCALKPYAIWPFGNFVSANVGSSPAGIFQRGFLHCELDTHSRCFMIEMCEKTGNIKRLCLVIVLLYRRVPRKQRNHTEK